MDFVKRAAKRKERELIVKLADEGKTCREIASLLGTSKSKASFWTMYFQTLEEMKPRIIEFLSEYIGRIYRPQCVQLFMSLINQPKRFKF